MNAISTLTYTNDNGSIAPAASRTSQVTMGLGPNQLKWLRRNIDAFKQLEEQRYHLWQDAVRAARMAGLI
jgi:hypothetical protein